MNEYIKKDQDGTFIACICRNTAFADGFYPCDEQGNEVQPDNKWNGKLYVCFTCGRIIDQFTGKVEGKAIENAIRL